MCFIIHPKHSKVKTAKKNIVCWKNGVPLEDGFRTFHMEFQYQYGEIYRIKKFGKGISPIKINEGFHSFVNRISAKHDCTLEEKVFEMIIPRGTKYYFNPTEKEYVSLAIKCVKRKKRSPK